eukprot:876835-Pyramimonas_sp.AAC.1
MRSPCATVGKGARTMPKSCTNPLRSLRTPPDPLQTVQHTLKMPLVSFTFGRVLRRAWRLHLT